MQGKGFSLRLGLLACVAVLIFGMLGGLSLAKDAFDDDFKDCPASTRIDAVNGLTIDRTDDEKEIRVSWDELDTSVLNSLGANGFRAGLTIIVDVDGDIDKQSAALLATSKVFDDIDFANDVTVSVAITQGKYVISDIAEAEFTSGMPAPSFKTSVWVAADVEEEANADTMVLGPAVDGDGDVIVLGSFYYLGFNNLFDNWFASGPFPTDQSDRPSTPKFRVGLQHGAAVDDPGDADFENYRITIEDSSGDLLGYQAETVAASGTYGSNKIVFGGETEVTVADAAAVTALGFFSNVRLSNQHEDGPVSPYYVRTLADVLPGNPNGVNSDLSYGNVVGPTRIETGENEGEISAYVGLRDAYAEPPAEYYDFPSDIFEEDGNYIIKAWAEDGDGTRISPQASIKLSALEGEKVRGDDPDEPAGFSLYGGYNAAGIRVWGDPTAGNVVRVFGLTIQDE